MAAQGSGRQGLEGQGESYVRRHAKASTAGTNQRRATGRGKSLVLALIVVVLLALSPAVASAAKTHPVESFSPLTGAGAGTAIHEPSGVGVDETTGNVFVTNDNSPDSVLILGQEGAAPTGLLPNGSGEYKMLGPSATQWFSLSPAALAYDNSATSPSKGTLYVYDKTTEQVRRYRRDAGTEQYAEEGAPLAAPGAGVGAVGAGVDGDGDLWLGSFSGNKIFEYSPVGATLHEYSVAGSSISEPGQIAASSSGDIFVQFQGAGGVYKCVPNGSGELEATTCQSFIAGTATGVAYDAATNHVYAALNDGNLGRIVEYDASSGLQVSEFGDERFGTETVGRNVRRVSVDSATGRVYIADATNGKKNVSVFGPLVTVPTAKASAASSVTGTKATLNGSVNPEGIEVTGCRFELLDQDEYENQADETQTVTRAGATGGTFTLSFEGQTTSPLAWNASAEAVEAALRDLLTIGAGNVYVKGSATRTIQFIGALAHKNLLELEADASGLTPSGASLAVATTVQGSGWGNAQGAPCSEGVPTNSEPNAVSASASGLKSNGATYFYRLTAENADGLERSDPKSLTTSGTVITEAASSVGTEAATLHGTVRPEGLEFSECVFEYKRTTEASYQEEACSPAAAEIEPDFSAHAVSASLFGVDPNATYEFRLAATNEEGTRHGEVLTFSTPGPPQITEIRARDATQGSTVLEAKIDPSGFGTTYRFEWGPTASYGNQVPPNYEGSVPSTTEAKNFSVYVTGLSPATVYHYRVVATNTNRETTASPDQTFETLNSCSLPDGRCFELVSPRDPGPVAAPGRFLGENELVFQAGPSGPGGLAYTIEAGLPDATRGLSVLYRGSRQAGGWSSDQLSPPIVALNEKSGGGSNSSRVLGLSRDLSCGVVASSQPLTGDPVENLAIEAGGGNLYRRNSDGSYDLITNLAPQNPGGILSGTNTFLDYRLFGLSANCDRVVFESDLHYPGIEGAGEERLYEWHDGALSNVSDVPDGGGEAPGEIDAEAPSHLNALSADGRRVFFTAKRLAAPLPGEVAKNGVFARIDGSSTIDLSSSETATADTGATYQGATPDGSKVYFTANAGLTAETSAGGIDLYEYDFTAPEGERLTDLSVVEEAGGAEVGGLLGFADDGSQVYFAARAQLVPGKGKTRAQNLGDDTFSIYDRATGSLGFAGTVTKSDLQSGVAVGGLGGTGGQDKWTSRVSPDGRYLLFESTANVTGYDSGDVHEAYLFDNESTGEGTVCVSCRQDGQAPVHSGPLLQPLARRSSSIDVPYSLAVSGSEARVFFLSEEKLATGGREGEGSLYEWTHGQVFHIAKEPAGAMAKSQNLNVKFTGASADGADLYFFDAAALNWENPEARYAVWDARIGGGFPEPPPSPEPCDPTSEGACQGQGSGNPSNPSAASRDFQGQGNVEETGNGASRCTSAARHAQRLSARAKKLRRNARKVNANGRHARAVKLNRKAKGLASKARRQSNQAKRCRKRLRANTNGRAGK